MSEHLEFFALERSPFADEAHAAVVVGTRPLRKVVSRIQAELRDGNARIGVCGVEGVGKSRLARALPKLFAGSARVATVFEPGTDWRSLRLSLARDWQLAGEKLSRAGLVAAARSHRLVLVIDRAEEAPASLLEHLDVLHDIRDEDGDPIVTVIVFVRSTGEEGPERPAVLDWLDRTAATRIRFEPLAPDAVADYIERQLRRAGYQGSPLFTPRAALAIHADTAGVPGEISRLCERLLVAAAARRLRTLDEPFVRSCQQVPHELASIAPEGAEEAWDDADHHPRETPDDELLLEHAISPAGLRPAGVPLPDAAALAHGDPQLEAYLSAPASEAELRAIRGGLVRRNLRPFALAASAAALGGLLIAHLLSRAAHDPPASEATGATTTTPVHAQPLAPSATPPVLGRLRGPVTAPPASPPRRSSAAPVPNPESAGRVESPLRRAGDLADEDRRSAEPSGTPEEDAVSEMPDYRPHDLAPPADIASPEP